MTDLRAKGAINKANKTPGGVTIYMQMGGTAGDASTLARTNGAEAAAKAFGVKLVEQYSGWDPQKMIQQFREAVAMKPDGIAIMGHPGDEAFGPLEEKELPAPTGRPLWK